VDRIYQQTFVDIYAKVAFTKLYDVTAADLLNHRVLPSTRSTASRSAGC
jgi:hypothetical protein